MATLIPGNYTLMTGTTGNHIEVTLFNPDGSPADLSGHGAASMRLLAPDKTKADHVASVAGNVVTLATVPNTITQAGAYQGQVLFADGAKSTLFTISALASL